MINYIVQGFLIALLISLVGFVVKEIYSNNVDSAGSSVVIDYDMTRKDVSSNESKYKGELMFIQKCASCYYVLKNGTGPALMEFEERVPWVERKNLNAWIRNPSEFMKKNSYTRELKKGLGL